MRRRGRALRRRYGRAGARGRWYSGKKHDGVREAFVWAQTPTEDTHGSKYRLVEGPFQTARGAKEFVRIWNSGGRVTQDMAERSARGDGR
jgi:hypothetical protein